MGPTVVFTVSLDADDVAVEQIEARPPRPPHHPFRDAFLIGLRDKRWRIAALFSFVVPALAAGVTYAITRGEWVSTSFLLAAALATPASAAWAGTRAVTGEWVSRVAAWSFAGAAGAGLALASVPGVVLAARAEAWSEDGAIPTLAVLALAGATGAWLGCALANGRRAWPPIAAAALSAILALAPIAAFAALLPETTTTEQIVTYNFTTSYGSSRPAYVCGQQTATVTRKHTEEVAWLAFGSPLAWVVDAGNFSTAKLATAADGSLVQVQAWTRSTRLGPDSFQGYCYQATSLGPPTDVLEARYEGAGPLGAQVATVVTAIMGALALLSVSRRRSLSRS